MDLTIFPHYVFTSFFLSFPTEKQKMNIRADNGWLSFRWEKRKKKRKKEREKREREKGRGKFHSLFFARDNGVHHPSNCSSHGFAVVSCAHDRRLAEANRDAAAANGALEAAARAHHAAQHPGATGSDDKEPAEHVGAAILDVPTVSRTAQRVAGAIAYAAAACYVDVNHHQQTYQFDR